MKYDPDLGEVAIGETIRIRTTLDDGAPVPTSIPLVAASAAPVLEWRAVAGGAVLATATATVTTESTGEVVWVTETTGLSVGRVIGDGWVTLPSGDVRRVLHAVATLVRSTTEYP